MIPGLKVFLCSKANWVLKPHKLEAYYTPQHHHLQASQNMGSRGSRTEKVRKIFQKLDTNHDGGLNRREMAALVVASNPRVKFTNHQINAILDELIRTYGEFFNGKKGLTFEGFLQTYDDGAGDVDRDFDALGLKLNLELDDGLKGLPMPSKPSSSSILKRIYFLLLQWSDGDATLISC